MSQQYPGQPPFGNGPPPGGGYPPGYGGAVPPGPGYPPPGMPGMAPPGMAPPAAAQPTTSKRPMLLLGIGCGALLLLGAAAAVAGVLWFKAKANSEVEKLMGLQASASTGPVLAGPPGELTGDCKLAYSCCRLIAAKSTANAAAIQACDAFKTAGYPQATCTVALTGYRKAAELTGVKCE